MKRVLITGGCGFIGSNLTNYFLKKRVKVIVLDKYNFHNNYGWLEDIKNNKNLEVELGDIRDYDIVNNTIKKVDSVIHLAALIGIPYSYKSPLAYINTNILGTYNILESCKQNKIKNIIVTSTSEVYGSSRYEPMDENHPTESQSPYAASKNSADELTKSYFRSFNLPIKIIRPFNAYGPRQSARAVIPNIIFQLNNKKIKKVKLGNLTPKRDYTYVEDLCDAYYKIYNLKKFGETYNVGTNEKISIKDLYNLISETIGIKKEIIIENIRKRKKTSEVMSLRSNFNKLNKATGWKPKTSFVKGLKKTIIWVKKNQKIYKDIYNI
jgi:NAD dependent epimerase/dehydratase|tara:strand:+ start:469 stop:1440 length:972 start_codon:yes stop_codon:yes gene_type:complete